MLRNCTVVFLWHNFYRVQRISVSLFSVSSLVRLLFIHSFRVCYGIRLSVLMNIQLFICCAVVWLLWNICLFWSMEWLTLQMIIRIFTAMHYLVRLFVLSGFKIIHQHFSCKLSILICDRYVCWPAVALINTRSIWWKMLGPFATASRLTPIHQVSLVVLLRAPAHRCPRQRRQWQCVTGARCGPMEWAQQDSFSICVIM